MQAEDTNHGNKTPPTGSGDAPSLRLKLVSTSFLYDSFQHDLVERVGNIAIYRKTKPSIGYAGYEVVQITLRRPHHLDPSKYLYDRVEHYPSSEEWGTHGWTYQTLPEARQRVAAKIAFLTQTQPAPRPSPRQKQI
jgi:hypothetical protein